MSRRQDRSTSIYWKKDTNKMQRVFLDTNAVIDFLGEREGFYLPMARVLTLADNKKITLYTSAISIATTYYILSKYESADVVLNKMRKFKMLCGISLINDDVIEKAMQSGFNDFEDAIQYESAIASQCTCIITRNEKDFKLSAIPVMGAAGFLKIYTG
jgi:predicted nucleic acid-binding protein